MNDTDSTRRFRAVFCLWVIMLIGGCNRDPRAQSARPTEPPPRYVAPLFDPALAPSLLDEPGRDEWQHPGRIVSALNLRQGESVADIGSGSGYLLPHLSRAVGKHGTVYAEEIQSQFLPALKRHAAKLGNIKVVLGSGGDPKLPDHSIGCFVLLTVYHEVQKPVEFLEQLKRAAKPGAKLAIIDFDPDRHGKPPAPVNHWVREEDVIREAQAAGWRVADRYEFISSQFFLVFSPS